MNVQIRAKDITLHANTKAHIESAIDGFSKYGLEITTVNVNVKAEKKIRILINESIYRYSTLW